MAITIASISCITKLGKSVTFKNDLCTIKNMQGKTVGVIYANASGLYRVEHSVTASAAVTHECITLSMLHHHLGHISADTLHMLIRYNSIQGIDLINEGSTFTCESCDYAKTTKKAIKPERLAPPVTSFGEKVHSDV
jgi:GAG-pre-integrase domain